MPASAIRRAVGPEPRSNAEPTALGSVVAVEGLELMRLEGWLPLMRLDRTLLSLPAWRRALRAAADTGVVEVEPVCSPFPGLELPPEDLELPLEDFPPPPVGRHSL